MKRFFLVVVLVFLAHSQAHSQDALTKLEVVFIGNHSRAEIKQKMDNLLIKYQMPLTDNNYLKVANVLVVLRKDSKKGVSEISILNYANKIYNKKMQLGDLLGLSASMLEMN